MKNKQKNTIKNLAVFCGSSPGNSAEITAEAYRVGKFLAKNQIKLIFGGSKLGIMGEVAKGVLENQGEVIGVIPEFLKHKEIVHPNLTELITTKTMQERKLKMHELSDGFIALPGGFGTLEEFFEILTWGQLGLHKKPIGLLNIDGFYDDLLNMFKTMVEKDLLKKENLDLIIVASEIESLYLELKNFTPKPTPKWMTKSET